MNARENDGLIGLIWSKKTVKLQQSGGNFGFYAWKKYFWVLNTKSLRLLYFKHDQAPQPKGFIDMRNIAEVKPMTDRENKFFYLEMSLRTGNNRTFRMTSRVERDKWFAALSNVVRAIRSKEKAWSLLSQLQQRTLQVSAELEIEVNVDISRLTNLTEQFQPLCSEALEVGIQLVSSVLAGIRESGNNNALQGVTILLMQGIAKKDNMAGYDPGRKHLDFVISITVDSVGLPCFSHFDLSSVLSFLTSNWLRNPELEGWVSMDPQAREQVNLISSLLHVPNFFAQPKFAPNLSNDVAVRPYLAQHVHATLMKQVYQIFSDACNETSPLTGAGLTNVECLRKYVCGIGILLEPEDIRRNRPPTLLLENSTQQDPGLAISFAIASQLPARDPPTATPQEGSKLELLRSAVAKLITHVCIAESCRIVQQEIDTVLRTKESTNILWENLVRRVVLCCNGALELSQIPLLILNFGKIFVARCNDWVKALEVADLYDNVFVKCVRGVRLDFGIAADVPPPAPSVIAGVFCEMMVLFSGLSGQDLSDAAKRISDAPPVAFDEPFSFISGVFSASFLSSWFKGYFSQPLNRVPFQDRFEECIMVEDSDEEDAGDHVAAVRSGETRILTAKDVVNTVYDAQGKIAVLKAGAESLKKALDALEVVFPHASIDHHDVVRLFTATLSRLRGKYKEVPESLTNGAPSPSIPLAQATELLKDFCEFSQSEQAVERGLLALPAAEVEGMITFQNIAHVMLCNILPSETVLAMRSRRDIMTFGLENTGKTLIIKSIYGVAQDTFPTIGINETIVSYNEWIFAFQEVGGRLRKIWKSYLPLIGVAHAIIYVVDTAFPQLVEDARIFLKEVLTNSKFKGLPVLVLLNNYTRASAGKDRLGLIKEKLKIEKYANSNHHPYFVVACDITMKRQWSQLDAGLVAGLEWLCKMLKEESQGKNIPTQPKERPDPITITPPTVD